MMEVVYHYIFVILKEFVIPQKDTQRIVMVIIPYFQDHLQK